MSTYCGTDIIEVKRIYDAISGNERFKYEIFTQNEINDIETSKLNEYKSQRYAGRFAAKEAIFKALSKILYENDINLELKDIEILNDYELNRRPVVNILKKVDIFDKIDIDVSISHIKENAIAMAIAKERCEKCGK